MTTSRPDLRLLPAAAAAWGVAALAPVVGARVACVAAALLAAAAGRTRTRPALAVVLVVAAGAAAATGLRLAARDRGPLDELAAAGRTAVVVVTVAEEPRLRQRRTWGAVPVTESVVRVRVSHVVAGGEASIRQPLLVVAQGEEWRQVQLGDVLRLRVVLRPASRESPVAAVAWVRGPPVRVASPPPLLAGAQAMREGLREAVARLPSDRRALLPALVVGDTRGMPDDLVADLRASGLSHLTAVSGANVAILLVVALAAARWLGARGVAVPAVGLLATVGFVVLARPQPSVLRAAVMGGVAVLAVVVGGRKPGLGVLFATVVGLLFVDPWLARSWGFALSVAATAGLLVLAPRWRDRWSQRVPGRLAEAAAVTLAAQLATLPLTVALAGTVSLVALPANLLAAPAVPPATVLGAAAAIVSPAAPTVAGWLGWLAGLPAAWVCLVARRAAGWPAATVPWPDGPLGSLLVVALAAGAALAWRQLRRAPLGARVAAAGSAVVLVVALLGGPLRWPPGGWLAVVCDVGQGDAMVVSAGPGTAVVVDVGPDPALVDRCLDRLGVERIPLLVLTHHHADHVLGLPGALDGRTVDQILTSPLAEPADQADAVAAWADEAGTAVSVAEPGATGTVGPVRWQVLGPSRLIRGEGSDPNNASVVLVLEVVGVRLLLTGDVEPAAQAQLLGSGVDLRADVLKVPHHGSANQLDAFVAAAGARLALVSVGADNPYGHPDPGLLAGLRADGVLVGRTDQSGDLAVVVEPGGLRLVTRRRPPRRRVRRPCHADPDGHPDRTAHPRDGQRGAPPRARRPRDRRCCRPRSRGGRRRRR